MPLQDSRWTHSYHRLAVARRSQRLRSGHRTRDWRYRIGAGGAKKPGLSIILRGAVRVGDTCQIAGITGIVEDIGISSLSLRTRDRSVVSIPNAKVAEVNLENFSLRDQFWVHQIFTLRFDTPHDVVKIVLDRFGEILRAHPAIDTSTARATLISLDAGRTTDRDQRLLPPTRRGYSSVSSATAGASPQDDRHHRVSRKQPCRTSRYLADGSGETARSPHQHPMRLSFEP